MRRTVSLRLLDAPDAECQATVEAYRDACRTVSEGVASGERTNARALQSHHYGTIRSTLPSQMACSVFRTVAGAWRSWRSNGSKGHPPTFRRPVAAFQHGRDWSLKPDGTVSFRVLDQRVRLPFLTGDTGLERIAVARATKGLGGARLVKKRRGWFLEISVTLPDPRTYAPATTLGVDVGINVLAVARAPGRQPLVIRGGGIRRRRNDSYRLRQRIQRKGTRASRRALRAQRGREQRFVQDRCRVAARDIVDYAKTHQAGIRLEDLTGIRLGKRWGRDGNRRLHAWAFRTLQASIADRAQVEGVPVEWIDPRNTSRRCPECGHTDASNRDGSRFHCRSCGYRNHADVVGATNIATTPTVAMADGARAPVNGPDERTDEDRVLLHTVQTSMLKPPTLVGSG